jgi:hypothetical protein
MTIRLGLMMIAAACGVAGCERESPETTARAPIEATGPSLATSAPAADPASCVTYDGAYATAPLLQVRGAADQHVNLLDRAEACPAAAACGWRRDAYVIGGDVVLASAPVNGFRCVYVGQPTARSRPASYPPVNWNPLTRGSP